MKKEKKLEILERFTVRGLTWLNDLFVHEGKLCACDGYILIYTKKISGEFNKPPGRFDDIFPQENLSIDFKLSDDQLEIIKKSHKDFCHNCENTGEVTWTYERHIMEYECPVCNGVNGGCVQIIETKLLAERLIKVIELSKELNCNIQILYSSGSKILFKVGEFKIIVNGSAYIKDVKLFFKE